MSVLIIAEAGVNHNGQLDLALKLVDSAKDAGADVIKFQTFKAERLVSKHAEMADYQKNNTHSNESQLQMLKRLELSETDFFLIKKHCDEVGIGFLSTAFDESSIDFLHSLGVRIWKIPSGELTNLPYLLKIASFHEEVILSTGMSTFDEVKAAVAVLKDNGAEKLTILHCTTQYPAPFDDLNLRVIQTFGNEFQCDVGYSDHTVGNEASIAAVALGARVIEKHFTLDKTMPGPDHKASLNPMELRTLIQEIRNVELALGDGNKRPMTSERQNLSAARKSIVASRLIHKDEIFTEDNLTTKRPGTGVSPMKWFSIVGKKAQREYQEDDLILSDEDCQ